jgi:DNA primase
MTSEIVAVVEGQIDALSLALCGLPAIAMIGTGWAPWLPQSLAHKSVLVATDADAAGDETAWRLTAALVAFECRARRLRPPCGKDWNDELLRLGRSGMQAYLNSLNETTERVATRGPFAF